MKLLYVGMTYRTAGLELRERLARCTLDTPAMLRTLRDVAEARVILRTCGRFEIYARAQRTDAPALIRQLADWTGLARPRLDAAVIVHHAEAVARHLLEVAAGLNSRILVEDQVLHQVRQAYRVAQQAGSAGAVLSALFQTAIHSGRTVRRNPQLRTGDASFAALAVRHLATHHALNGAVAVLGSGVMAQAALRSLAGHPRARPIVVSRHLERAETLARRHGAAAAPLRDLAHWLQRCRGLISCTTSQRYIVTPEQLARDSVRRTYVDLGMPRTIDPAVGTLPEVDLRHLDDLPEYRGIDEQVQQQACTGIEMGLQRFRLWCGGHTAAAAIRTLLADTEGHPPCEARLMRRRLHATIVSLKEDAA